MEGGTSAGEGDPGATTWGDEEAQARWVVVKAAGHRGRGAFAREDIEEGTVLFTELPLVGIQHGDNHRHVLACSQCFRHCGSLRSQILRLLEHDADVHIPAELPHDDVRSCPDPFPCRMKCGVTFCSAPCEQLGWTSWHSLLCTRGSSDATALREFTDHALETNEAFQEAARLCALVALRYEENGRVWEQAWEPVRRFEQPLWWEGVAVPQTMNSAEELQVRQDMRTVLVESWSLLRGAICVGSRASWAEDLPLFADGGNLFGRIMGLLERNNTSILVRSPVEEYFLHVDSLPDSEDKTQVMALLDSLGERYSLPCEGMGVFPLQAVLNHECVPNTSFLKRDEDIDGRVVLSAIRSIKAGEELVHSYIEEGLPLEERTEQLRDYGFICDCRLCVKERSDSLAGSSTATGAAAH